VQVNSLRIGDLGETRSVHMPVRTPSIHRVAPLPAPLPKRGGDGVGCDSQAPSSFRLPLRGRGWGERGAGFANRRLGRGWGAGRLCGRGGRCTAVPLLEPSPNSLELLLTDVTLVEEATIGSDLVLGRGRRLLVVLTPTFHPDNAPDAKNDECDQDDRETDQLRVPDHLFLGNQNRTHSRIPPCQLSSTTGEGTEVRFAAGLAGPTLAKAPLQREPSRSCRPAKVFVTWPARPSR
jgi:hypothetical protein